MADPPAAEAQVMQRCCRITCCSAVVRRSPARAHARAWANSLMTRRCRRCESRRHHVFDLLAHLPRGWAQAADAGGAPKRSSSIRGSPHASSLRVVAHIPADSAPSHVFEHGPAGLLRGVHDWPCAERAPAPRRGRRLLEHRPAAPNGALHRARRVPPRHCAVPMRIALSGDQPAAT